MKFLIIAFAAKIIAGLILLAMYTAIAYDRFKRAKKVYQKRFKKQK